MRNGWIVAPFLSLGLAACGGDEEGNADGGGAGTGGSGGNGGTSCSGAVSGDVAGEFSACVSAINAFPEGTEDSADPIWIYTLVAAPEARTELDPPLESLGINLFVDGQPAEGSYALDDALPDTDAFVYAPFETAAYEELLELSLTIDTIEQVTESDDVGYRVILYELGGTFEMTLADEMGDSVTVTSTF